MADVRDQEFLRQHAGQWVAWDRDQTHLVASGTTFEELKTAAAQAGEQSVLVAKVPTGDSWLRRSHKLLYVFAVFIALGQSFPSGPSPISQPLTAAHSDVDSAEDDQSAEDPLTQDG